LYFIVYFACFCEQSDDEMMMMTVNDDGDDDMTDNRHSARAPA